MERLLLTAVPILLPLLQMDVVLGSHGTDEKAGSVRLRGWSEISQFLRGRNFPAAAAASLQSSLAVRPHRRQPTRLCRPWDPPGKNTGVGCCFLL